MPWLWWSPLVAVLLHIGEEFVWPGGFARWDREYRPQFGRSITPRLHIVVNSLLVVLCLSVASAGLGRTVATVAGIRFRNAIPPAYAAHAWIGLMALLFSNAIFHLVGALRTRRYSPGLVTSLLLYVPLAAFGAWHFVAAGEVSPAAALAAAAIGGSYHLWARLLHAARA